MAASLRPVCAKAAGGVSVRFYLVPCGGISRSGSCCRDDLNRRHAAVVLFRPRHAAVNLLVVRETDPKLTKTDLAIYILHPKPTQSTYFQTQFNLDCNII